MATEIVMPQMGESITEGTVSKWLKKIGDVVEKDENILEISTDKVDAEVPSSAGGILLEIRAQEGDTVEVGFVVAIVGEQGESGAVSSNGAGNSAPQPQQEVQQIEQVEEASQPAIEKVQAVAASSNGSASSETVTTSSTNQTSNDSISDASANSNENAVEIVMPQMGESITEGTISKWLKKVGDKIENGEPVLEISTDKVDAEVPASASGILLEARYAEGETVEVGTVVALIGAEGAAVKVQSPKSEVQSQAITERAIAPETPQPVVAQQESKEQLKAEVAEIGGRSYDYQNAEDVKNATSGANGKPMSESSVEDLRRLRSSPLVRKIAEEHKIDISRVTGSGASGRVTRDDIMNFISSGAALSPQQAQQTAKVGASLPVPQATQRIETPQISQVQTQQTQQPQQFVAPQVQTQQISKPVAPQVKAGANDRIEPMSTMRKKIAEHMVMSKQTSPHVTSVYEIDMTNVVKTREASKATFLQNYGTKLTFMPFVFQAVTQGLRKFPILNSQVSGDQIVYKSDINLGMAVALDWGLIVPVIKRADTLSIAGLTLAANDLADRARTKKLVPDEVQGGTFTITNTGVFGGLFGIPIINQPQAAILNMGTIEKRPKVMTSPKGDDYVAVRQMAYFALTYDHRIVDGADAERFLSALKETLETVRFSV
ncbi:MAG: 2-oxo acid dehydrogenase subunit E2 [Pyrinomonadaceae bacterium]|nr:2-oxo acid dehydrogenase subunit E2 [Pyrinomonadaceae bacterium]